MKGWVTWVVASASAAYGVGGYLLGLHDQKTLMECLGFAGGLIGIGRKLDRAASGE